MKRRPLIILVAVAGGAAIVATVLMMSRGQTNAAQKTFAAADQLTVAPTEEESSGNKDEALLDPLPETEAEWRKILTRPAYRVLRLKDTERAFSGKYAKSRKAGVYRCAGCGQPVFSSAHKFDSGTGWPSYWQPLVKENIALRPDNTLFVRRIEVICSRCEGHLGHVFSDGPPPTGLRYCINSIALKLDESSKDSRSVSRRTNSDN